MWMGPWMRAQEMEKRRGHCALQAALYLPTPLPTNPPGKKIPEEM